METCIVLIASCSYYLQQIALQEHNNGPRQHLQHRDFLPATSQEANANQTAGQGTTFRPPVSCGNDMDLKTKYYIHNWSIKN